MQVEQNKVVSFHYTLTLDSGEVADTSRGRQPLDFLVGGGQIIPGLESELLGLAAGDKKIVKVQPEDAYGVKDARLVQVVEKSRIPGSVDLQIGEMLRGQSEDGSIVEGKVVAMDDQTVQIDFNHPLADQVLTFDIEIVDIRDASPEELAHGHAH